MAALEDGTKLRSTSRAVVIGGSSGGIAALSTILASLAPGFQLPMVVVLHMHPRESDGFLATYLNGLTSLPVVEAIDKMPIEKGRVHLAPADYHLLVEQGGESLALSAEARVNYSRPSIDVLFESAAVVWRAGLVGVLLTGANNDGTAGLALIRQYGGLAVVQDPATAESSYMPRSAINAGAADHVLALAAIAPFLNALAGA